MSGGSLVVADGSGLPRPLRLVAGLLVLFFTVVFVSSAFGGGPPWVVLVGFGYLYLLFAAGLLLDLRLAWGARRAYRVVRGLVVGLGEGRVVFGAPVEARRVEYVSFTGGGLRPRPPLALVEPLGGFTLSREHVVGGGGVVLDRRGRGGVVVGGLELRGRGLDGVLLLYIPGSGGSGVVRDVVEAPWGARLRLDLRVGPVVEGVVALEGRGRARVYVEAFIPRLPGRPRARILVASVGAGGERRVRARLAPEGPVYVVLRRGQNLLSFTHRLPRPMAAGGLVEYRVRVVLSWRLHKHTVELLPMTGAGRSG